MMLAKPISILLIDDQSDIIDVLQDILKDEGYRVFTADSSAKGDEIYRNQAIDLVLLDIWMPQEDGLSLLKRWCQNGLQSQVIMMSGHGTIETAIQATKLGAFDFIEKPISTAKLLISIENVTEKIKLQQQNRALLKHINPKAQIIGKSPVINALKNQLQQIKYQILPVIFLGKSGVGKNYYARYLHQISNRSDAPFISVNAASLARYDQMQAIFGEDGLIHTAQGGTLYIDEIADLQADTQSIFAACLENRAYRLANQQQLQAVNVRFCFASRKNLALLHDSEELSSDLFYQVKTLVVNIPELHSYKDDIPEIISHYVYHFVDDENLPYRHFSMQALNHLRQYHWPGNVRELRNFIQRALVLASSNEISLAAVIELLDTVGQQVDDNESVNIDLPIREAREHFERAYFIKQLNYCEGNIARLADRAGLERTNLYRKLKSLGIEYK